MSSILKDPFSQAFERRMRNHHEPTVEHSIKVMGMSIDLALDDGRTKEEAFITGEGGLFHDAGKLTLPSYILDKPDALTEDEFLIIRKHPILGFMYLTRHGKKMPAQFAIGHHELSPNPYPRTHERRKEFREDVSMDRRKTMNHLLPYVALADVFDALTVRRPYNPEFSREEIADLLRSSYCGPEAPLCLALSRLEDYKIN